MDPELKKLLEETRAIAKDNNDILRSIRHHQWLSFIGTVLFWVIAFLAPFYFYQQYVQPYVSRFTSPTGATTTGPFGLPSSADVQKLIDSFKQGNTP